MSLVDTSRSRMSEKSAGTGQFPSSSSAKVTEKWSNEYADRLSSALQNSRLNPLHVEVTNESYWYYMRHKLRPKRHAAIIIKHNPTTLKYDSYIYDMKRRDEDLEIVPMKLLVGSGSTKWQAMKLAEAAMKDRDRYRPVIQETELFTVNTNKKGTLLNTYFKLIIVSDQFQRVPSLDRIAMVHFELAQALGMNPIPHHNSPFLNPPSYMRGLGSVFDGQNVCQLQLFRLFLPFHSDQPLTLMITTLTPAQWKPSQYPALISERLGVSHGGVRAMAINNAAAPVNQRKRLKLLTQDGNNHHNAHNTNNRQETLGTLPHPLAGTVSIDNADTEPQNRLLQLTEPSDVTNIHGHHGPQLGGVYGHFFADLSADVRAMVLERHSDNQRLIRLQHAPPVLHDPLTAPLEPSRDSFQPVTNLSRQRKKLQHEHSLGDPDIGTDSPAMMKDDYLVSQRRLELIAIRLQRIRRANILSKAVRLQWRKEYAVLMIQRMIRGRFARSYTTILTRLQPLAAMRIQRFRRVLIFNRTKRAWEYASYRLTRCLLPYIKRFIRNCYLSWILRRHAAVLCIQAMIRRRLVRVQIVKLHAIRLLYSHRKGGLFHRCAVHGQRIIRGYLARRRVRILWESLLQHKIDIPAAVKIQRIFRGRLAKFELQRLRYEHACLLLLQSKCRRFVHRLWRQQVILAKRIKHAAITIQRVMRGCYDRKIISLLRQKKYYQEVYLPAVILIQTIIRGYKSRLFVHTLLRQARAVKVIQRSFRLVKLIRITRQARKRELQRRFELNVILIQAYVRRMLALKHFKRKLLAFRGQQLLAAKIISRAWATYKMSQRFNVLLEEARRNGEESSVNSLRQLKGEILQDLKEMAADIAVAERSKERYKERRLQVERYLAEAALRLANIKKEMTLLTVDDFERGWAEALGQEYEFVKQQELMAAEELRLLRVRAKQINEEVLALQLEIEDTEIELDQVDEKLLEAIERSRQRQLRGAELRAERNMRKLLYRERVHWKITSNRPKKMLAARSSYHRFVNDAKEHRPVGYATSIAFEPRRRRQEFETLRTAQQMEDEARSRGEAARPQHYEVYALPVQRAYDNAVASSLTVLRGVSLDDRAAALQAQYAQQAEHRRTATKGQFAPLKPDYQGPGLS